MKMELEVKAPCDGTITFTAQTGSQVSNGQKLAVIGGTLLSGSSQPACVLHQKQTRPPAAASGEKPVMLMSELLL